MFRIEPLTSCFVTKMKASASECFLLQRSAPNVIRSIFPHPTGRGCWILCWNPRLRCFHTTPPPSIPPKQHRQQIPPSMSSSPVDPAENPARTARQWIPPSIPPELLASGSRRVSRPAKYPAEYPKVARQWIPPSISQVAQWIPLSIPLRIPCRWILLSIRPVSSQSGSPGGI